MARDLIHFYNDQAWGELRNLMPRDYGKTPPVVEPVTKSVPYSPTVEEQELTCPKLRRIRELEKRLAELEVNIVTEVD